MNKTDIDELISTIGWSAFWICVCILIAGGR